MFKFIKNIIYKNISFKLSSIMINYLIDHIIYYLLGIGDWGLGIGPNPQSPKISKINISFINTLQYYIINFINFNI